MEGILQNSELFLARHNLNPPASSAVETNGPSANTGVINRGMYDVMWDAGSFATMDEQLPGFDISFEDFTGFEFIDN